MPAPRLVLEGRTYEQWFASLGRHRRAELRRRRRRLEEKGATIRLADSVDDAMAGLRAFSSLHYDRWRPKGGSGALNRRIEAMLADAAGRLVPSRRLRLWSIEVEGRPISALVFVAAGGEVSYWLGGFDPVWGGYGPAIETVRAALEHAWSIGDRVIDFGIGGQQYKYTFADEQDVVERVDLVLHGRHAPARLVLAPEHLRAHVVALRHAAFRRLSPTTQQRIKTFAGRLRLR
jgi:CelD/BcsL family acetyltransferase involved in cellulose biosynthesis